MAVFWVFMLIFCVMYGVQPRRNFDHTIAEPEVHQADTELFVDIGDSATLQCCVYGTDIGVVIWYKQPNRKQPRIMCRTYKTDEETFFHEFQNPRFQAERSSNCSNMIISNIIQSDEAVYYCSIVLPYGVFGNGTYLKIKGTSKPTLSDDSVVCEASVYRNSTNINAIKNTVLGLGTALSLCALLIFCLTYLKCKKCKMNTFLKDCPERMQESQADILNYASFWSYERSHDSSVNSVHSEVTYNCIM
ncbi:uncharacterized protein LOC124386123 [Silurus meridionalis]|uniref:uncharacterized protein LOC124386123 n=1 Tax=Silurus meridionalis TaxID=175797 RepID=UPI001EEB27C2|nr:uncharacterized protein LOC124386123 [Silurus meridionalis]